MLVAIYRSLKRDNTYLYIAKRDDFSSVPAELMQSFGSPRFVMMLSLANHQKLAVADIEKVKNDVLERGYYLQIPPPIENLLVTHLQQTSTH